MLRATQRPLGVSGRSPDPVTIAIAECIPTYSSASLASRDFCQISWFSRSTAPARFCRPFTVNPRRNRDRMCKCNTVTRDDIPFAIWSGLRPDTPYQCVRAQCGFRFSSASSPTRSLTFGRWGCGERCHLSHVVGDSAVVLSGMSRQIALQTRSEALRRTRRGLNARQGMEGAKNAYRAFQEVRRADTLARGFQVARNRVSPCKAHLHGTGSHSVGRWS